MSEKLAGNKSSGKKRFYGTLIAAFWPFAGISMVFSILASFELHDWMCDLLANFWVQYLAVLILFALILIYAGKRVLLMVVGPFILLCLVKILPVYFPHSAAEGDFVDVSVLSMNVNTSNQHYERALQSVARFQPDIVLFEEIDEKWLDELKKGMAAQYSVVEAYPRDDNFGIAIFSKIPYVESRMVELGYVKVPAIEAEFEKGDKRFTLFGAHVVPPTSGRYFRERNLSLDEIALLQKKNLKNRFVLVGDLNCTMWSPFFKDLLKNGRLKDTSVGFGVQPTWPVSFLGVLGIGIDHCLVSEHFEVVERRRGDDVGSDHLPLYVKLSVVK